MLELFENAHLYEGLAGEMKTQDFSVLRILLAVMHTVFSRYKPDGSEYGYFSIDPKTMRQLDEIDEDSLSETDLAYYTEVNARILKKLSEVS